MPPLRGWAARQPAACPVRRAWVPGAGGARGLRVLPPPRGGPADDAVGHQAPPKPGGTLLGGAREGCARRGGDRDRGARRP
eukprot:5058957-Alexandrium_andersonii.AAC.1